MAVVLWMLVIFLASTDVGSAAHTSKIIGPFLRWIYPAVSDDAIRVVQAIVRKSAHVTVYGVLAALTWRAQRMLSGNPNEWFWRESGWIVLFCFLYAASDELHQSFVSSRGSSPVDVMIDTAGVIIALLAIRWSVHRQSLKFAAAT